MGINWNSALETGVKEVDNQHKELFKRVDDMLDAAFHGKGRQEIGYLINYLERYVDEHFKTEERIMHEYSYPYVVSHKAEHQQFTQIFSDLKKQYEEDGPDILVTTRTNKSLMNWLVSHVNREDKSMADYIRNKIDS